MRDVRLGSVRCVRTDASPIPRHQSRRQSRPLVLLQNGIEVYRDVDANFNEKADQYRWLATAGTRWGLDPNEDGVIDSWKMISPKR